jgi:hypothetical protein
MSVQGLQNPFQRLAALPTVINWRGTWLITQTYFLNDVVISPINGASYILTGQTSVTGGADPSLSILYQEISPLSTGITGIQQGTGILITGPANNPTITNNGVQTLAGDGVTIIVDNTNPNQPIISSNSITSLQQGTGISIDNTNPQIPVVTNSGVRQILPADISVNVSNPTGIVSISANGLLGLTQGPGITIDTTNPQNPYVSNSGVISLAVGNGLSSTGGVNPSIANTGVLTVAPADTSIIVSGTAQNVILRTSAPVLTRIFNVGLPPISNFSPVSPGFSLVMQGASPPLPNIFTDYLANGAPDAQGIFMIDLNGLSLIFQAAGAPSVVQNIYTVAFYDGVLSLEYQSATILNQSYLTLGQAFPITTLQGAVYFNVADARTVGLRQLTSIRIYNNTNGGMLVQSIIPIINGTYYSNGLQ